jgi:hypothetical protein
VFIFLLSSEWINYGTCDSMLVGCILAVPLSTTVAVVSQVSVLISSETSRDAGYKNNKKPGYFANVFKY